MGLDVYFIRKPKHRHTSKPFSDITAELQNSTSKDLKTAIEDLYYYTTENHLNFENCLIGIITNYLYRNSRLYYTYKDGDEVAYFRELWWIVNHFNYSDEDYGKDVEIAKAQIEDLVTVSKKLILTVEKHFTDKGLEIEQSPINYSGDTIRWGGDRSDYLVFKNSLFTDKMIEEAGSICSKALGVLDDFLFYKVCEIYIQFSRILNDTDFTKEAIFMNADW